MAKVDTNPLKGVLKREGAENDNIEVTLPDTPEVHEAIWQFVADNGGSVRFLTPRNRYGAAGMPDSVKIERLLADLAAKGVDVSKITV